MKLLYPITDATPPQVQGLSNFEMAMGVRPSKVFMDMTRIIAFILLIGTTMLNASAQSDDWQMMEEKAGLFFMYKLSDCESGPGVLLRIENPSGDDPVYEKFVINVTQNGRERSFMIDLSGLENKESWEGNCETFDSSLRLILGSTSGITSVTVKLPSEK